ncbi:MAG: type II secretion system F family protein [Pseudomonadota bacterium]
MSAFHYTAYDGDGRRVKGVLTADTEQRARQELRAAGLFLDRIVATNPAEGRVKDAKRLARRGGKLSPDALAMLTRQLAVLLGAELPVEESLKLLMGASTGATLNRLAAELRDGVRDGRLLSGAMAQRPAAFPEYYVAAIQAGEKSGRLAEVLETLADFLETRQAVREGALTALISPAFVGAVSLLVAGVLLVNVAPELTALFEQTGQPLPRITEISLALGGFIGRFWPGMILGLVGFGLALRGLMAVPRMRRAADRLALKLPLIARLARLRAGAIYLRTLALILNSGLPASTAMGFAVGALGNTTLRQEAETAALRIEEGRRISTALAQVTALPPIALQLIETGERTGRLPEMTERAAGITERTLATLQKRLSTLLEPLMMILVGALVLTIVLSVLLPIFDLQTSFVV